VTKPSRTNWQRRRAIGALVFLCLMLVLFTVRLVDVQVVSASAITAQAAERRGGETKLWGERGMIVDANGTPLATSVDRFDITVSPRNVNPFERKDAAGNTVEVSVDQAYAEVAAITGQPAAEIKGIIDGALAADPNSPFAYVRKLVTLDVFNRVRALGIPWLYYDRHPVRVYPNGAVAGNLVGFVGSDGAPLAGIELGQDKCLAGQDGASIFERSADGVEIPGTETILTPAKQGGEIRLTINADLQWMAQQSIAQAVQASGGMFGHVTVMEAKTGRILALAEYPTVDPNNPSIANPEDRGSRAFTSPYEPGSTMKMLTLSALLDQGLTNPAEVLQVPGRFEQDGASFADDWAHGTVTMNVAGVMAQSSNIGTAILGQRLSAAQRYDYFTKFGLGRPTEAGFLGEESGTLHPYQDWDSQTNYSTMFGQGLTVTAPQIASIYQTIANGGVREPVQLMEGCYGPDGQRIEDPAATEVPDPGAPTQVISPAAAQQAMTLLEATAQHHHLASQMAIPGYRIGFKSGTAEVAGDDGAYLRGQYLVSLAGVAPMDDPQYVVAVSIMRPSNMMSTAAAAPVWHDVMAYVLQANRVAPSPQPWAEIPTITD